MDIVKPSRNRFAKALFYGPPGNGKTRLLGTAQEDERTYPLILGDFEGGYESLAGIDIDIVKIRSLEDFTKFYAFLQEDHGYKSLGIDSATETHIYALQNLLTETGRPDKQQDRTSLDDYGRALIQMRRIIRQFRDLEMHVFITALDKEGRDKKAGTIVQPYLFGAASSEISAMMSIVGYLGVYEDVDEKDDTKTETHRTLLLASNEGYRTKARAPIGVEVPEEIVDPTITKLLDALKFE